MAAAFLRKIKPQFQCRSLIPLSKSNLNVAVNRKPIEHVAISVLFWEPRRFCSKCKEIGIVDYEIVKEIAKEPEKLLIDVRRVKEIEETGLIPGSINIPQDCLADALGPKTDKDKFCSIFGRSKPTSCTEIIFTCRSGKRARESALDALQMGYKNVKVYEGSWLDWHEHQK